MVYKGISDNQMDDLRVPAFMETPMWEGPDTGKAWCPEHDLYLETRFPHLFKHGLQEDI